MAYIYQITNTINDKVYIGKTEEGIEKRFAEHCRTSARTDIKNRPLYSAMRKYGTANFRIECLEVTDNPEEREMYWIKEKNSYKYGYNATLGGDGRKYLEIDPDLVVAAYEKLQTQAKVAKEFNICADTVRKILEEANVKILTTSEIVQNAPGQKINKYTLDGEYLGTFDTPTKAAKSIGKTSDVITHITNVCKGKRKTAYGYKWTFAE